MKTLFKIIAGVLAGVLLLLAAAAVYVKFFFDPNDLREQLTQQVQSLTGRELVIEGDFSLSVFPWFAVNVGRTSLSDDPGFGTDPLLMFDSASASVKLRPLIKKQIELGATTIEGMNLSLIRKADGTSNWEAFLATLAADEPGNTETPADKPEFAARSLGAIEIIDANIRFVDETIGDTLEVSKFNLRTGKLVPGEPFDVDLSTLLSASNAAVEVTLNGRMATSETQLEIQKLDATVNGNHHLVPFDSFAVTLSSGSVSVSETKAMLEAPTVEWQMTGGRDAADQVQTTSGSLTADSISRDGTDTQISSPALVFQTAMIHDSVSAVNGEFGGGDITVRNDSELSMMAPKFSGTVTGGGIPDKSQAISLTGKQLNVDMDKGALQLTALDFAGLGLQVLGAVNVTSMYDNPDVNAPLQISEFNLRELMAKLDIPVDTADPAVMSKVAGNATVRMDGAGLHLDKINARLDDSTLTGNVSIGDKGPKMTLNVDVLDMDRYLPPPETTAATDGEVDAVEIPAQMLREFYLDGLFKVGQLTFGGIKSQNVEVGVKSDSGNVRVFPARASLYGGKYAGDVRIDASGEVPSLALDERFEKVDIGAMSMDLAGTNRLTGNITGSLKMTARGHNTSQLRASSNGTTAFSITDGVLDGINIMESVRNIVALANKEAMKPDEPDRTEFRKLAGTAVISNGVLNNDDLTIEIPLLRVTGGGFVDLNTRAINYKIGTRVVQEGDVPLEKELLYLEDYTLPVFISGTYDAPIIDKGASVADLAKQYAKKQVKDAIFGRLGLGGKKPAATDPATGLADEEPPKSVETALKDKFRGLLGGRRDPAPAPADADATADPAADPDAAPPEEEEEPESPEDAVKDALKGLFGDGN